MAAMQVVTVRGVGRHVALFERCGARHPCERYAAERMSFRARAAGGGDVTIRGTAGCAD